MKELWEARSLKASKSSSVSVCIWVHKAYTM
jgi:hypothetical protein